MDETLNTSFQEAQEAIASNPQLSGVVDKVVLTLQPFISQLNYWLQSLPGGVMLWKVILSLAIAYLLFYVLLKSKYLSFILIVSLTIAIYSIFTVLGLK